MKQKTHRHVWIKDLVEILQVPELCWASSIIFVGNGPSFTDEGGGVELRQLDTTGVDAAKIQPELIEFQ